MLVIGPNLAEINALYISLENDLKVTNLGSVSYFLGMEITRNTEKKTMYLSQEKYLENILKRFEKLDLNSVLIPAEPGLKLRKNENKDLIKNAENIKRYQ